ncbi:MAG: hypothetical protein ACRDRU_26655 [Pseudonocardiaceae bacterium]
MGSVNDMDKKTKYVHEVKVVRQAGAGGVKHQAICTCGWKGPRWEKLLLADEDAKDHRKEYAD